MKRSQSNNSVQTVAALLKLKATSGRCAEENISVKTVCLPPPQHRLQPGVTCEIAGYGKEQHGEDRRPEPLASSDTIIKRCLAAEQRVM